MKRIDHIAGALANFMKIALIIEALRTTRVLGNVLGVPPVPYLPALPVLI